MSGKADVIVRERQFDEDGEEIFVLDRADGKAKDIRYVYRLECRKQTTRYALQPVAEYLDALHIKREVEAQKY